MNSCAPISGFVCPSRRQRGDLSLLRRELVARRRRERLRTVSPVASSSRRARSANASSPCRRTARARSAAARAHRRAGARGAATRRRGGGRAPAPPGCACGRAARSPRGRAAPPHRRSLNSARERASMPSAQSVPLARVDLREALQRGPRLGRRDRCARPPRSARPRPGREPQLVRVFAAPLGARPAHPRSGRGRCRAPPGRPIGRREPQPSPRWATSWRGRVDRAPAPRLLRPRQAASASAPYGREPAARRLDDRVRLGRSAPWPPPGRPTATGRRSASVSAIGSNASAPSSRASSTWRSVSTSQLSSSPRARATRHASHSHRRPSSSDIGSSRNARNARFSVGDAGGVPVRDEHRQPIEQQVARPRRPPRRARQSPLAPPRPPRAPRCHRRAGRRTAPPRTHRGRSRARARRRALPAAWPPSAAAAARRGRGPTANAIWPRSSSARALSSSSSGPALGQRQQADGRVDGAGLVLGLGRRERPARPLPGSGVSSAARSRNAAAAARPPRACARPAERSSSAATSSSRPGRRMRAVPGPPIGVQARGRSPRPTRRARAAARSAAPPGRPRSGPAGDGTGPAPPNVDQPGRDRRRGRRRPDPEPRGGPPHQHGVAGRAPRRPAEQPPRVRGQRRRAAGRKLSSMRLGKRSASGSPNPPASSAASSPGAARAARAGCRASRRESGPAPAASSGPVSTDASSARASLSPRPSTISSGSPRSSSSLARLAYGEHERDRLRQQPPGNERQRLRRDAIEPLRVVDDAHQRLLLGATSDSRVRTARPTRKRSGGHPRAGRTPSPGPRAAALGDARAASSSGAHS